MKKIRKTKYCGLVSRSQTTAFLSLVDNDIKVKLLHNQPWNPRLDYLVRVSYITPRLPLEKSSMICMHNLWPQEWPAIKDGQKAPAPQNIL